MKTIRPIFFLAGFCCLSITLSAHSQVLVQHAGALNPLSEGFHLLSYGSPQLGPVLNDQGLSAWSVGQLHTDAAQYAQSLSSSQVAGADWQLTYRLRLVQAPATPSYDISSRFYSRTEMFSLYFGEAANGDPTVQVRENSLLLSPVITVNGAGSTYNTFCLNYHAGSDSADLWINGVEVYTGMQAAPFLTSQATLDWSGYQHANDVLANWNLVSLALVPEPSTVSVALLGGLVVFYQRWRGQRSPQ